MKISFASPVENMNINIKFSTCFFCIAPVCFISKIYKVCYQNKPETIVDNGFYEYKKGKFSLPPFNKVIDLSQELQASYIILPDVSSVDLNKQWISKWRKEIPENLKLFIVYHYHTDSLPNIKKKLNFLNKIAFEYNIGYVGLPFFLDKKYADVVRTEISRDLTRKNYPNLKFHLLGMGNPNTCFSNFHSVDSAGPIWQGLHGVKMVTHPTKWWDKPKIKNFDFLASVKNFPNKENFANYNCEYFINWVGRSFSDFHKKRERTFESK